MKERSSRGATENLVTDERSPLERPERASDECIEAILSITRELFSDPIKVAEEEDPEIENERYVVFHVAVSGNPREIINRQREWHRKVIACAGDEARCFRISLDVLD